LREGDGKGADRGVDGLLHFYQSKDERRKIIVQIKGGGVKRGDVGTLPRDVNNQKAAGGILLTLEKPTKDVSVNGVTQFLMRPGFAAWPKISFASDG